MVRSIALVPLLWIAACGGAQSDSWDSASADNGLFGAPWEAQWARCQEGYTQACLEAAAWLQGDPRLWPEELSDGSANPPSDPDRTLEALGRACDGGEREACDWMMGRQLGHWPGTAAISTQKQLADDCKTGDAISCVLIADALKETSPGRATSFLQRGCETDLAEACFELGTFYQRGRGVPKSLRRARALYDRACGAPDYHGCLQLGQMLWRGQGGKRDREEAERVLDETCKHDLSLPNYGFVRGWPDSCAVLESLTGGATQ